MQQSKSLKIDEIDKVFKIDMGHPTGVVYNMSKEIERKFIVVSDNWFMYEFESVTEIEQVYLTVDPCVRIRINDLLKQAKMCCKTPTDDPRIREEIEFAIDYDNARKVVDAFDGRQSILKERFVINVDGKKWEIDRFADRNCGLVMAEIELDSVDEEITIPDWAGIEVTNDPRFLNVNLAQTPFKADWMRGIDMSNVIIPDAEA